MKYVQFTKRNGMPLAVNTSNIIHVAPLSTEHTRITFGFHVSSKEGDTKAPYYIDVQEDFAAVTAALNEAGL